MVENTLEKIIKKKLIRINDLKKSIPLENLKNKINENNSFINFKEKIEKNIKSNKISIIAEIKKASPSAGTIIENYDPVDIASIYKSNKLFGETTNIGMNSEISIEDLAKLLMKLLNVDLEITSDEERVRPLKSEVERLYCDNSKILEKTLWRPSFSLEEGLKGFIDWMTDKSNLQFYKAGQYNV